MELFNKLKRILFDEVTTEIPVISKEEKASLEPQEKTVKKSIDEAPKKRANKDLTDEVIIQKIETPKRETKVEIPDDEHFDMPKLKEEAKEEVKRNSFTFPVFEDDEKDIVSPKRREKKEEKIKSKPKETTQNARRRESTGYTNAFDYSYGKYRGDYKSNRDQSHEILTKTLEEEKTNKVFTPSPIISPVYGVLNENYKKEDIVAKKETPISSSEPLDLDSVRRKAYGTLEEEIAISLSKDNTSSINRDPVVPDEYDDEDDGISIDDLLVDSSEGSEEDVLESFSRSEKMEETELFKTFDENEVLEDRVIDLEDELVSKEDEEERFDKVPLILTSEPEEVLNAEKTENKKESVSEEDLFDLIDSLYQGKGEE